ncbi:MAG: mechanosensitive ion channel family protein [Methanomicrobiales archaeon]|nr:mechanosensitive ion channel family protein [Methanomicrobiales archaeon]
MILDTILYNDVTLRDLLLVLVILLVFAFIAKVITLNLKKSLIDKMRKSELELLLKIVNYGILLLAVIVSFPMLSIDLSGLLVAGGFGALVIGFASQSVVTNLVSGLFLIIERPVKIGDQVNIGGVEGYVEDIRVLSTIMRGYDGVYVRVPNEKVFTSTILNYVADVARIFEYKIGIAYGSDAEKALNIVRGVIEAHPIALKYPAPVVFVDELGDSSVNIVARIWAPSIEWFSVRSELLLQIKQALDKGGIEIPFPQRVIWFGERETRNAPEG